MYYFEAENIRFELIFDKFYEEDYKVGCPYNTFLFINVSSYGFCGTSEWTIDFNELAEFAYRFKKMHEVLTGELELKDKEYGSFLKVKCDGLGGFNFTGKLISSSFQKLEFNFALDQSYLKKFVEKLYSDFGKDFDE